MEKELAKAALIDNHSSQEYRPQNTYPNVVNADGIYLGSYIPYIGGAYFTTKPRVLIYAMAQNLAHAPSLIKDWHGRTDKGMLRHYYVQEPPHVYVHPYDTGHLKVIAALKLSAYPRTTFKPSDSINDLIAITNFVKFSFYQEGEGGRLLDVNPPLDIYAVMWKSFCRYEVELLKPDVIITVGNEVDRAVKAGLRSDGKPDIAIKVPFPGRLNLNARWVPVGKRLIEAGCNPAGYKQTICALLAGTPNTKGFISRAIETDWYYFLEMKEHLSRNMDIIA